MKQIKNLIEFEDFEIEKLSMENELSEILGGKGLLPALGDIIADIRANGWNCVCNECNICNSCNSSCTEQLKSNNLR